MATSPRPSASLRSTARHSHTELAQAGRSLPARQRLRAAGADERPAPRPRPQPGKAPPAEPGDGSNEQAALAITKRHCGRVHWLWAAAPGYPIRRPALAAAILRRAAPRQPTVSLATDGCQGAEQCRHAGGQARRCRARGRHACCAYRTQRGGVSARARPQLWRSRDRSGSLTAAGSPGPPVFLAGQG
jgi:hypothetical protein